MSTKPSEKKPQMSSPKPSGGVSWVVVVIVAVVALSAGVVLTSMTKSSPEPTTSTQGRQQEAPKREKVVEEAPKKQAKQAEKAEKPKATEEESEKTEQHSTKPPVLTGQRQPTNPIENSRLSEKVEGVIYSDVTPDGSYPNVVGKPYILDYGVLKPRPIYGPIPFKIVGKVPVVEWDPKRPIAEENIARGTPIIMRNSVLTRWKALGKWTPEYFSQNVSVWRHITRPKGLRRAFINYEPNTPFEDVTPWDFWENEDSRNEYPMPMEEWFRRASNTTDGMSWFFAEEVPKELLPDLYPRHQLKLKDQTWVYFSVWMGEGGATTAAHWDMDDNFYCQFYGRKRFLLFHPRHYKGWKSYPRVSPNHKQVQMRVGDPSRYSYRMVEGADLPEAQEAILYPGDMLFIPAYWYHHVEAMISPPGTSMNNGKPTTAPEHLSISANFWSTKSMYFLLANDAAQPFSEKHPHDLQAKLRAVYPQGFPDKSIPVATRMVLASVVADRVFGKGTLAAIARRILFLRYVDLFGPPEVTTSICPPRLSPVVESSLRELLEEDAKRQERGFNDLIRAASELEFMNHVELMLVDVVLVRDFYAFLHNCFEFTLGLDPNGPTGFEQK